MLLLRPVLLFAVVALLLMPCPALAQPSPEPYVLARLTGSITLDGHSDEPAWAAVAPLTLTMISPTFKGTLTERTEIRLAYDNDYLYASGRFYEQDPANIRSNSFTRDLGSDADDYFGLIIDTFNDNENALAFMTTPAGIRVDQAVFDDAQISGPGMPVNESWNTFWDVAAVVTDEGWFAEIRIPFSSLRFQGEGERVVMGLTTWRWIARKSEAHSFPPIEPKWMMGHIKPSIMQDVVLEGIQSHKPLYITPYALGGLGQEAQLNGPGTAYMLSRDGTQDVGLDLKYSLTSNLTLDLTANTDFAQVEADDQQVNLTRFSLFFPEKRQFFQERGSVFEFNTGGQTRLFYSRRIGLSNDGPVRIFGGARMVGRVGPWDVGLLDMQTQAQFGHPSENFGVLRLRRQVFNENSYAGGIVTSRLGDDGTYNVAYGLDGTLRLRENDYLLINWAQTFEDDLMASGLNSGLLRTRLERRSSEGFGFNLGVTTSGPDYNPGMGFIFRTDFTRIGDEVSYTWLAPDTSPFFTHQLALNANAFLRNADGSVETAFVGPQYFFTRRSGDFLMLRLMLQYEDLRGDFELSDNAVVPAGTYTFVDLMSFYQMGPHLLRANSILQAGAFYDGWRISWTLGPTWNLSRHVELSADYQFNRVRFPDRDQRFSADVLRLRLRAALNTHLSFSTFAQYNTLSDAVVLNARLRYNFREGNDLYIVYNEALNTDRYTSHPALPFTEARTVLLKYTYTFIL